MFLKEENAKDVLHLKDETVIYKQILKIPIKIVQLICYV